MLSAAVAFDRADQAFFDAIQRAQDEEDKAYLAAAVAKNKAKARVDFLNTALEAERKHLAELQTKRVGLRKEHYLRTAERACAKREAAAAKLSQTIAAFVADTVELFAASESIFSPVAGVLDPGTKVFPAQLAELISMEIARLSVSFPRYSLPGEYRAPCLNKLTIKPLVTEIAEADRYLLAKLSDAPEAKFSEAEKAPEPAPMAKLAPTVEQLQSVPVGPTQHAYQVRASIPKQRLLGDAPRELDPFEAAAS